MASNNIVNEAKPNRFDRICWNFPPKFIVWLDPNIHHYDPEYNYLTKQLGAIVNNVTLFQHMDECVQYLQVLCEEKIIVITSGTLGEQLLQQIHSLLQVALIYLFCGNPSRHSSWASTWSKIKGIFDCVELICDDIQTQHASIQAEEVPISFVDTITHDLSSVDLNRLEPSFMYTQLFKDIILAMKESERSSRDFLAYCRQQYADNHKQLEIIDEFNREYSSNKAIWWYTRPCFIYEILNKSLRLLECGIIIKMAFFIHDLHHQIAQLHQTQSQAASSTTYRGQGLSNNDFEKLQRSIGGLLSFNSFLSTSDDRDVSLLFAESSTARVDTTGVLFVLTVNPQSTTVPFANVRQASYFSDEAEILFSMHAVFRIVEMNVLPEPHQNVIEVRLKLTSDDDSELRMLTNRIREHLSGLKSAHKLGSLLIGLRETTEADKVYSIGDLSNTKDDELAYRYQQIALIRLDQGDYQRAIDHSERALSIWQQISPLDGPTLATSYNNVAGVYFHTGDYAKALGHYEKALRTFEKSLPANHPYLAGSYNNIAGVYNQMGEYAKALDHFTKALQMREKSLPANHPDVATSYNNIAGVHHHMGDYAKALGLFKKALQIHERSLPANHPDVATSYHNIALVYHHMGDYVKALGHYEKALRMLENRLHANHPAVAGSHNNIAGVYNHIGEYSKALSHFQKALRMREKSLPANHPDVATSYNNVAGVYYHMGEYSKALGHFQKALQMREKSLPANHPDVATSCTNIGATFSHLEDFRKALFYLQKASTLFGETLPSNHPNIVVVSSWIDATKENIQVREMNRS